MNIDHDKIRRENDKYRGHATDRISQKIGRITFPLFEALVKAKLVSNEVFVSVLSGVVSSMIVTIYDDIDISLIVLKDVNKSSEEYIKKLDGVLNKD